MTLPFATPTEPAPGLLVRVADELELCRSLVRQVEADLAPLIEARQIGGAAPQALDLLDQVLADLAVCLAGLAGNLSDVPLTPGPVLAKLRLDDLRRRLSGGDTGAPGGDAAVALF